MLIETSVGNGGFVKVVDALGDDTTVVNAARVSFGKKITEMREQDIKLLDYLATNGHTSPFRHIYVQFHVRAPEFVARQWYKHVVGSEYSFKDQPWNEISGRYVEYDVEMYVPEKLRAQSANKKQGSADYSVENEAELLKVLKDQVDSAMKTYKLLCDSGVAKEQARMVLPLNFYTEWYWTASLQALSHFVKLRTDSHAQLEIQEFARAIDHQMFTLYPNAWVAMTKDSR